MDKEKVDERIRISMLEIFNEPVKKDKYVTEEYYIENDPRTHYRKVKGE